jgi:hypothetical protein
VNFREDTVTRIDAGSGNVIGEPIPVGKEPTALAIGDGSVWVANCEEDTVTRIAEARGEVVGQPIRKDMIRSSERLGVMGQNPTHRAPQRPQTRTIEYSAPTRHGALNMLTPTEYENRHQQQGIAA